MLLININSDFKEEVINRIIIFFQEKILSYSSSLSCFDLIKLASTYLVYQNNSIIGINTNQIKIYRQEIINSLNPIWLNYKIYLLNKEIDMLRYIYFYLFSKSNFSSVSEMIQTSIFSNETFLIFEKDISSISYNLKSSLSDKFISSVFNEAKFEEFKLSCLSFYKEELKKTFESRFFHNSSYTSQPYSNVFNFFKRHFDLNDLYEILEKTEQPYSFKKKVFSLLFVINNLSSVPCLK